MSYNSLLEMFGKIESHMTNLCHICDKMKDCDCVDDLHVMWCEARHELNQYNESLKNLL